MSDQLISENILFVNKPSGVPTHKPSAERLGFVEWSEDRLKQKLFVCHRLDKETSGALLFAKTKEAAAQIGRLFEDHQVKKEYWLLSHKKSAEKDWVVEQTAEKTKGARGGERPSKGGTFGGESLTRFQRINDQGSLFLYKAFPQTGKTHQIRKHAIHSNIPILGDAEYGGQPFPRLMLHSKSLAFQINGEGFEFEAEPSRLFSQLDLCKDSQFCSWICSVERRMILFPELMDSEQVVRLCHAETGDLRLDKAGHRLILGWWKSEAPSAEELLKIEKLMNFFGYKDWIFQWRPGVNQVDQLAILKTGEDYRESTWTFSEGEAKYVGSLERGQNFGLFLDQRKQRLWVNENSQSKRVLNLFAFTCGFSLNAALGGAKEVVSVDSFQKYLQWGKENFQLNNLDPDTYQFRAMDALEYLKFAHKKNLFFDTIVCDPPSFSRHKKSKKVFRVERDFKTLLNGCFQVLAPGGHLFFSTNYEKWDHKKWQKEVQHWAESQVGDSVNFSGDPKKKSRGASKPAARAVVEKSQPQWDYEWQNLDSNMKSFLIRRACPLDSKEV